MTDQRLIDVTYTRKRTWYITAPCGWHAELPGECESKDIRTLARNHQVNCCKGARLNVETSSGYKAITWRKAG